MIAVPFRFGGEMRGVVSAVQLRKAGDDLRNLQASRGKISRRCSSGDASGRLVEHKLLTRMLGLELSL